MLSCTAVSTVAAKSCWLPANSAKLAASAACLAKENGLSRIDHVVLSHGHPDHYGGLLGLLWKEKSDER